MSNEIYSLQSIRETVDLFVKALNFIMLDQESTVGVMEGGFVDDKPWLIRVMVGGDDRKWFYEEQLGVMEFRIKPQQFLDQVDHGGGMTKAQYAEQMFRTCVEYLAERAKQPDEFVKWVGTQLNIDEAAGGEVDYGLDTGDQLPS